MSFTDEYFKLGYQLQKQAGSPTIKVIDPDGYSLFADKGKELDAIKGANKGSLIGSLSGLGIGGLGLGAYALSGNDIDPMAIPLGLMAPIVLGGIVGTGVGGYLGGRDPKKK